MCFAMVSDGRRGDSENLWKGQHVTLSCDRVMWCGYGLWREIWRLAGVFSAMLARAGVEGWDVFLDLFVWLQL